MRENEPNRNTKSKVVVGGGILGALFVVALVIGKSGWLKSSPGKQTSLPPADGKKFIPRDPSVTLKKFGDVSPPNLGQSEGRRGLVQYPPEATAGSDKVLDLVTARAIVGTAKKLYGWQYPGSDIEGLRDAARKGDRLAAMFLGYAYADGINVIKDEVHAARWFQVAMDKHIAELERAGVGGDVDAMLILARSYSTGLGAPRNVSLAEAWVTFAVSEAPPARYLAIAGMLERDFTSEAFTRPLAKKIIVAGAMSGIVEAQYAAGLRYENAQGAERNLLEAYAWYNLAAAQGHEKSRERRDALEIMADGESTAERGQRRARNLMVEIEQTAKRQQDRARTRSDHVKMLEAIKAGNK